MSANLFKMTYNWIVEVYNADGKMVDTAIGSLKFCKKYAAKWGIKAKR